MTHAPPRSLLLALVAVLALAGCGGGGDTGSGTGSGDPGSDATAEEAASEETGSEAAGGAAVSFVEPTDGAAVASPVPVRMQATGLQLEPAGAVREGAGHLHIMVDTPCVTPGQVIPADDAHKHYGQAQTETTLELPPGQHTLCRQAGDGAHTALGLTEEITITVQ